MVKRVGIVYAQTGKKKGSNPVGVVIFVIIGFVWWYYVGEFAAWFSDATGGPAR